MGEFVQDMFHRKACAVNHRLSAEHTRVGHDTFEGIVVAHALIIAVSPRGRTRVA